MISPKGKELCPFNFCSASVRAGGYVFSEMQEIEGSTRHPLNSHCAGLRRRLTACFPPGFFLSRC